MSHMIDSLTYTGEVPWHGLGRALPEHVTVDEIIRFGGLDWQVVPRPVFQASEHGTGASVPGWKALTRSDRPDVTLSVVSEAYGIVQNAEALALASAIVGEGSASAEVCGALDDGRRVFLVLNMREAGFAVAGEEIKPYVVCYAGHDGSTSVGFRFTPVRVVCQNTLTMALGPETPHAVSIRHTRNAARRVATAAAVVAKARAYFGTFNAHVLALVNQRLSLGAAEEISVQLFPTYTNDTGKVIIPENQIKVVSLFRGQERTTDARIAGTKWGFYNAVTALLDHNARGSRGERRMIRALGSTDVRDKAMRLLLAA